MAKAAKSLDKLIDTLEDRVKELNCMFELEEVLSSPELSVQDTLQQIVNCLPSAFQFPDICHAKIVYRDQDFTTDNFVDSQWSIWEDITIQGRQIGGLYVTYDKEKPEAEIGPFLVEEQQLLNSAASRLAHHLMYQRLKMVFNKWDEDKPGEKGKKPGEWSIILDLLRRTDIDLFVRISRKMLNFLVWNGISEAEDLLQMFNPHTGYNQEEVTGEANAPLQKRAFGDINSLSKEIFQVAGAHLSNSEILENIQKWMQEAKTSFLVRATARTDSSLSDIARAIHQYYQLNPEGMELTPSARIGVRAALIRHFFSDQLEFVNIAKNFVRVLDFNDLLKRMIFPIGSYGKLGGKSAGIFLANRVIQSSEFADGILKDIKIPKTWYVSSDVMIHYMHYNNLEDMMEQKYKPVEDVRKEYPQAVQLFKNSHFSEDISKGLSVALDDFDDSPLVVRSSSLLEDRLGSAFSGKYKSLFLANQGSKVERLEALQDAIAEVYASTIGPDPIEYRAERGLLDFHEEMGILIQEVVGKKVGHYFLPAFAGVAFSNNEFRWSPRIRREDGLIRMVPGLGTRAVDRVSDDYPILIAPGQPGLRANVSQDEIVRYAPAKVDVINLNSRKFETKDIQSLFRHFGAEYPMIEKVVSVFEHNNLRKPGFNTDFKNEDLVVSFEGLFSQTQFVKQMEVMLKELQGKLAVPVDVEFAHDGDDFYLLQCRPQSYSRDNAPAEIPVNISIEQQVFSANRYISNGRVDDIQYIVYVIPEQYNELSSLEDMKKIGRCVGKLNKILPQRKFILMGPGRWGSRGDIKLGVNVTYSDINNTAVLIEIARKKGNYVPDLSFGTHFFQDLVEASIRYLPLYPDEEQNVFNDDFLLGVPNSFAELVPEYAHLSDYIKVIDLAKEKDGLSMSILMNGEINLAAGILRTEGDSTLSIQYTNEGQSDCGGDHWKWRLHMAEEIAAQLSAKKFGVNKVFLLGITAKPASDIDLAVNFTGTDDQKKQLDYWFNGWSLALDEMNFMRTGFKAGGLLDIYYVDDKTAETEQTIAAEFDIVNPSGIRELELKTDD